MAIRQIKKDIHSVGAIHWDRRLFDELIPLPEGTSYNAYVIQGSEKTALIDTVDPEKWGDLENNLSALGIKKLDYIVTNHAEQDHSGSIPMLLEKFPGVRVVTNEKCKKMEMDLLHVPEEKFMVVADNATLSLGNKTLRFIMTPWVHWPETMVTWLEEDKILFSCDFFGSHYAGSELFAGDNAVIIHGAKRYYAEIMMPFRATVARNIDLVTRLDIEMIAPSHGPVYDRPDIIIDAYREWTSDKIKKEVVVPFVSMHGSTRLMVDYLIDRLIARGFTVRPFNLPVSDIGELAMSLVDASTVIIGSPVVLAGAHPAAAYAAFLANALRPKVKYISIVGSFGWGGKMVEQLAGLIPNLKGEVIDPVLVRGLPTREDYGAIDDLVKKLEEKHAN